MANILENIAFIDRAQNRLRRAATLLGAAEQIREVIDQGMLRPERERYEQELAELQRGLPADEFDQLWHDGRALSTDAVVALALQQDDIAVS